MEFYLVVEQGTVCGSQPLAIFADPLKAIAFANDYSKEGGLQPATVFKLKEGERIDESAESEIAIHLCT